MATIPTAQQLAAQFGIDAKELESRSNLFCACCKTSKNEKEFCRRRGMVSGKNRYCRKCVKLMKHGERF